LEEPYFHASYFFVSRCLLNYKGSITFIINNNIIILNIVFLYADMLVSWSSKIPDDCRLAIIFYEVVKSNAGLKKGRLTVTPYMWHQG
jgi:hypothetical protein